MVARRWHPATASELEAVLKAKKRSASPTETSPLSPVHNERLQELVTRTSLLVIAAKFWDKLSDGEREKLGGNLNDALGQYRSAGEMWCAVRGGSPAEAVVRAAKALKFIDHDDQMELLRAIYAAEGRRTEGDVEVLDMLPEYVESEVGEAVLAHPLVMLAGGELRVVYWKLEQIKVNWTTHRTSWDFLWSLAKAATRRECVDRASFGFAPQSIALKDRRRRLKNALLDAAEQSKQVAEFDRNIKPGSEAGTYQLDLMPDEIWLRRYNGDAAQLELTGG